MKKTLLAVLLLFAPIAGAQDQSTSQDPSAVPQRCDMTKPQNLRCAPASDVPAVATHGLLVAEPKVYDDYYLQGLLGTLKNRLASLNALDQATLLGHIGNVQGADLRQMSVALSASGPPTPGVSTFAPAAGVTPFAPVPAGGTTPGSPTTTTPGTTTTLSSITPTAPTPTAPSLTMPGTQAMGSLDTLNEEMQLASEITNLQLLLDGALTDKLQKGTGQIKSTITLGFPITIEPPSTEYKDQENRVAEIEVTVCTPKDDTTDPPSIVTLLPQERTYNVAGLVDKSFLGSVSAVLGGFVNVGGGFLWGHKRYYLVQQQEMVALRRPRRSASDFADCNSDKGTTTFAWQIHPVLGQKYVRPGMTQAFVQFSGPPIIPPVTTPVAVACVRAGWRETGDSGNRIGNYLHHERVACFKVPFYSTQPSIQAVSVTDIGKGMVSVEISGPSLPGVSVRSGQAVVSPAYSSIAGHTTITFQESAQDIVAAGGAWLIGRDGTESQVLNPPPPAGTTPLTIDATFLQITPYSGTQSLVRLRFQRPSSDAPDSPRKNPYVVTIGGKVFGLSDAPFSSFGPSPANPATTDISLVVPTELLIASPHIGVGRLLWDPTIFQNEISVPAPDFAVAKTGLLTTAGGLSISLTGTGLDNALLVYPSPCQGRIETHGPTFAIVTISTPPSSCPGGDPKELKQVVICRGSAVQNACDPNVPPVAVDVPKTEAPKPSLAKHDPIAPRTSHVEIKGEMLDKVVSIQQGKTPINFRLSLDKKPFLLIDLPASIADNEGVYILEVVFADKSTDTYSLTVQRPKS